MMFAFLAGFLQSLSPDHWLPLSLSAWRRGWSTSRTATASFFVLLIHLAMTVGIYLIYRATLGEIFGASAPQLAHGRPFRSILGLCALFLIVRLVRLNRLENVFRSGQLGLSQSWLNRWRAIGVALVWIGPAESLWPLLFRAQALPGHWPWALLCFSVGTLLAGSSAAVAARFAWNRPFAVTQGLSWISRPLGAALPTAMGLGLALAVLLRGPN